MCSLPEICSLQTTWAAEESIDPALSSILSHLQACPVTVNKMLRRCFKFMNAL